MAQQLLQITESELPGAQKAKWKRRLIQALVLFVFAALPAYLCQYLVPPPQDRYIHMEAFRYGKNPSVIYCNWGDRLHLTFSTKDTGHSFFLEEFDVDARISPGISEVAVFRTSNPQAPPTFQREVVIEAKHDGWFGWFTSRSQFRCHVWCGPMHAFEHGNLIIAPNRLLYAGLGLLVGIPLVALVSLRGTFRQGWANLPSTVSDVGWDLFQRFPWMKTLVKKRWFQVVFLAMGALLLYVVVVTSAFGTHVAGRNLGIMIMWVVWMFFLAAVLTPLGGRIWCLACPLPWLGDILQRRTIIGVRRGSTGKYRNQLFGLNKPWPQWLSNAWPKLFVFLSLGTFSTVLVTYPPATAWVLVGMVILALGLAMVYELRAFCRYLCPITAFIGLYSMAGKLALRAVDQAVCDRCKVPTCQLGNPKGWACPYGLCASDINENNDCGMCTECIKSCSYGNITLRVQPFAHETNIRSISEAFLAMVMLVLGAAYSIVDLGHWAMLRDYVNLFDKKNWELFGVFAIYLWVSALIGLPGVMFIGAAIGRWLSGVPHRALHVMTVSAGALVPIGLMLWIAFTMQMLFVNLTFVAQSLSDPFGWGWDFFGTRSTPWHQLWPAGIPWLQVGLILAGLYYSLRNAWRIWLELTPVPGAALKGMVPVATLLLTFSGCFVWFFAG